MGLQLEQAVKLAEALLERTRNFSVPTDPDVPTDGYPFSCSIGMTYYEAGASPAGPDEIIEIVDRQMYDVKKGDKNSMSYKVIAGEK